MGVTTVDTQGSDRTFIIVGMILLIFLLVIIVTILAYKRPAALQGRSAKTTSVAAAAGRKPEVEVVMNPLVLSICIPQDKKKWFFDRDLRTVQLQFPKRVVVEQGSTSDELTRSLVSREFQLLHLRGWVDEKDGHLIFESGESMSVDNFAALVTTCKARLVLLGMEKSMALAKRLLSLTNVIATYASFDIDLFLAWEAVFYENLGKGQRLSRSYESARASTPNAPIVLLMNQDIVFSR